MNLRFIHMTDKRLNRKIQSQKMESWCVILILSIIPFIKRED